MKITVQQGSIQATTADTIIVNLFQGVAEPSGATGAVNQALGGAIGDLIAGGDFQGKLGETATLYPRGALPARRVIIVGLGPQDGFELEGVREAAGAAIKRAVQLGATEVATIIHGGGVGDLSLPQAGQAVVESSLLALYKYEAPRSLKKDEEREAAINSLTLVEFDGAKIGPVEAGARVGQIVAESVNLTRTLVNQPSNVATPTAIAAAAEAMCAEVGLTCRVLDEPEMRAQGMGALLAVTQGASQPAKFIIIAHNVGTDLAPVVLVGKGVTFDTGGYSLKSAEGMLPMKGDMAGAAAVIGAMRAVARLNLSLPVVGLLPMVENVVSATAYKPNEVFIAKNGVSIEVVNTDAEGRLILADALCYADTLNPAVVIDVATLTGAKVTALGERTNALFSNDYALGEALRLAGQQTGEPFWRMPLDPAYDRELKSDVADLKNMGGRAGGSLIAARFLAHFVGDWPWAHLDIAGSEFTTGGPEQTERSYMVKGASGVPVRTLVEFLRNWV
jgi:leucyl aminopeptidase